MYVCRFRHRFAAGDVFAIQGNSKQNKTNEKEKLEKKSVAWKKTSPALLMQHAHLTMYE